LSQGAEAIGLSSTTSSAAGVSQTPGVSGSAERCGSVERPVSISSRKPSLEGLTSVASKSTGAACARYPAGESETAREDETAAIFWGETNPAAVRPRVNRTATMPLMRHMRISRAYWL